MITPEHVARRAYLVLRTRSALAPLDAQRQALLVVVEAWRRLLAERLGDAELRQRDGMRSQAAALRWICEHPIEADRMAADVDGGPRLLAWLAELEE